MQVNPVLDSASVASREKKGIVFLSRILKLLLLSIFLSFSSFLSFYVLKQSLIGYFICLRLSALCESFFGENLGPTQECILLLPQTSFGNCQVHFPKLAPECFSSSFIRLTSSTARGHQVLCHLSESISLVPALHA